MTAPSTLAPATGTARPTRLHHLDHLRAGLTVLVLIHHLACTYALPGAWYLFVPTHSAAATTALSALVLLDQAFFMGLFFLLAGYFTPGSYDRKGGGSFLRDRLVRLLIPVVVFVVVLGPIAALLGGHVMDPSQPWTTSALAGVGAGPLWFVETLLVFGLLYALARRLTAGRPPATTGGRRIGYRVLGAAVVVLAVASFLIRLPFPLGAALLDLPTPSYLAQYVGMFVVGVLAYRRGWLDRLPAAAGRTGAIVAGVATLLLFPVAVLGSPHGEFAGGPHWQAAVYVCWDSIFSISISLALIALFRRYLARPTRIRTAMSHNAYGVYVIHAPILVLVAVVLRAAGIPAPAAFGIAVPVAVALCFVTAALVRRLPGARRVL